ncbi:helix-turn-helix transcriptional regulator [Nonomuraea endophytica]|uniref:helix-turn-helix transcriptional regulator n=1 Tax=Nonomuraea endophytica TaxID=714136 RepID=UPI0037C76949
MVGINDPIQFRDRLQKALVHHFGWKDVTVLNSPSAQDRRACHGGCLRGRNPRSRPTALVTHPSGIITAVIESGADGLAISVTPAAAVEEAHQQAVLDKLGRHLMALAGGAQPTAADRPSLTLREQQVAELVAAGLTNDQIAGRLYITVGTVKKHLSQILAKSSCTSRTQLAVLWQQLSDHDRLENSP